MSKQELPKKQLNSFYKYTGMAAKMIAVILVFTLSGIELDKHVSIDFDLFTLLGALIGSIGAIYSAIRDLTK